MVETAVYDKTIFDAKREGLGIRIKKSQGAWRTISFPESQHITSFKVINRGGNDNIVNFNSIPYTSTTGYPETLYIGADADNDNYLFTKGLGGIKSGVPGIIDFNKLNDSIRLTKRSQYIDLEFETSTGSSSASAYAPKYGISDITNMTPLIIMYNDCELFMTNIRDADNPLC